MRIAGSRLQMRSTRPRPPTASAALAADCPAAQGRAGNPGRCNRTAARRRSPRRTRICWTARRGQAAMAASHQRARGAGSAAEARAGHYAWPVEKAPKRTGREENANGGIYANRSPSVRAALVRASRGLDQ